MLWTEFIEGTKCKDTRKNYRVYKNLEEIYMNNDTITKELIYEVGKKLVDNSLTEEEKKLKEETENKIESLRNDVKSWTDSIKGLNELIEREEHFLRYFDVMTEEEKKTTKENIKYWKSQKKKYTEWKKTDVHNIGILKSILEGIV